MEQQCGLTIETFLAVAEMVASQLRIKDADRWTPQICQLKFVSFTSEFPEVNDRQFLWAAEQWLQATGGRDFLRYPTWRELMAPLYRSENGMANRSWGFRADLPALCAPTPQQQLLLPATPCSISPSPDPHNSEAYVPFTSTELPCLPPAADEGPGLTPRKWADYLNFLAEIDGTADQPCGTAVDPGTRPGDREVVDRSVQQEGETAHPPQS